MAYSPHVALGWRRFGAILLIVGLSGCVAQSPPAPVQLRETPPPWPAPRDAISHIERTGLEQVPLNATSNQRIFTLRVEIDGEHVPVPAYIGVDRLRAVQAPIHTHDDSGTIWLEGDGTDAVTLGHLFILWGVRFTDACLGAACGGVSVMVDGRPVTTPSDVRLVSVQTEVEVSART